MGKTYTKANRKRLKEPYIDVFCVVVLAVVLIVIGYIHLIMVRG